MRFDRGYISPYFVNNQKSQKVELEKPLILITEHKITSFKQILKFLEYAMEKKRPLLIIADDIESEPLTNLLMLILDSLVHIPRFVHHLLGF